MIDIAAFFSALHLLFGSWQPWLVVVPGLFIGLLFHAIPGLTTSMAIALCLPILPYMDFLPALIFMTAMYTGSLFGVAIPAILLNIPGSPAAVATTFDGFPMTRAGRHDEALGYALAASVIGQMFAYFILLFLVQPVAAGALKLGPPEMSVIAIWGLTLIAGLRGRHFLRGLIAGLLGLLIGTIGFSARGNIRGTLGLDVLLDGVPIIPAVIGMFAAAELLNLAATEYAPPEIGSQRVSIRKIFRATFLTLHYPMTLIRGSVVGAVVGILPGGHAIANMLSYSETKRTAKDPEKFGHGDPRGVIAAEAGNASSEGGSMATLLALGIPTGGATAIMLVAFDMHNITGGPQFMRDHKDIVYAVILSNLTQAVILFFVGLGFIYCVSHVVKVPMRILAALVLSLAVMGSYIISHGIAGPITLGVFAIVGWLMQRFDYPVAAAVVGLLLSRLTEGSFLRTFQMSGGDPGYFLERPIASTLLALLVISVAVPIVRSGRGRPRPGNKHTP